MDNGVSLKDLSRMMRFIDICIEVETNSSRTYQHMAHKAGHEGARAMLAWLYNIEAARLRRLEERRRRLIKLHPEVIESGEYEPRKDTGLSKMGSMNGKIADSGCLEILRYAVENEARAKKFFQRKAKLSGDPFTRLLYAAAAQDQEDRLEYLGGQREVLLQQQVNQGAKRVVEAIA